MSEWQATTLGHYINFRNGKSSPEREDALPFPVYGSNGIIGYANSYNATDCSIVIGRVGSFCGSLYFSRKKAWVTDNAIIAEAKENNDACFFFYLLSSLNLNHLKAGSGQPLINQSILSSIKTCVPEYSEQKAIAAILGALDDKIELNRRMNATLEAMARALFKSWLVDFDPVRAKMEGKQPFGMGSETAALFPSRLVPSELGDIPEGWTVCRIEDLGRVVTGKTPSTAVSENFGNDIPFITIPDLDGRMFITSCGRYLSKQGAASVRNCILPVGAVMMSCIATVGLCGITTRPAVTNQQINSLICNEEIASPNYVYWLFKGITVEVHDNGGGGSVYTNVSKSRFGSIKILQPPIALQHAFDQGWFEKLKKNQEEVDALSKLRDYLLPKLISGDIRIPDAEKFVEAV